MTQTSQCSGLWSSWSVARTVSQLSGVEAVSGDLVHQIDALGDCRDRSLCEYEVLRLYASHSHQCDRIVFVERYGQISTRHDRRKCSKI